MTYDIKNEIEGKVTPKRYIGAEFNVKVGLNQKIVTVADCEATTDTGGLGGAWTGGGAAAPTISAGTDHNRTGTNAIKVAWDDTSLNTYALFTLTTAYDMSWADYFGFWASHDETDNTNWDAAADFTVQFYNSAGTKVFEWESNAATVFLNTFRLQGDVPHYFELPLSSGIVTGQDLKDVKSVRFVATTTEKENSKALYIDHVELYQWGTGAGPLRGGTLRCYQFAADVNRGIPVGISDPVLTTLTVGGDNSTSIKGFTAEDVDFSEEPLGWVIVDGVVNTIAQEVINAGEGGQLHGAAANATGYDVDDGAADGAGSVFVKFDQAAVASGQHPAQLVTGYGTYAA
jgi:hypothetical protein